jgi:hypothetical protein
MDLSSNIGSLRVVGFHVEIMPEFETFVASKDISSVLAMNSQRDVYVSC